MDRTETGTTWAPGSVMRGLWAGRGTIFATTLSFGAAPLFAAAFVPPVHRTTIEITGDTDFIERWSDRDLGKIEAELRQGEETGAGGLLAVWLQLLDRSGANASDAGITRKGATIVAWAESGVAGEARARAKALASRIVSGGPGEPAMLAPVAEILPLAASAIVVAPNTGLRSAVADAQDRLEATKKALAAAQEADPFDQTDVDRLVRAVASERQSAAQSASEREQTERVRRSLATAAPNTVPASVRRIKEWSAWRAAWAARGRVAAAVSDLSRTLLDGHPRMETMRSRLADAEADLRQARDRFGAALQERARALRREERAATNRLVELEAELRSGRATLVRITELSARLDAERNALLALERALAQAEPEPAEVAVPETAPRPAAPPPELPSQPARPVPPSVVTIETERRPNAWPIAAVSSFLGFVVSSLYVLGASPRRRLSAYREDRRALSEGVEPPPTVSVPSVRSETETPFDIAAADDVIGGIVASGISRAVVVAAGRQSNHATTVEIVRRLALRGQQAALVDLSEGQEAARAMGVASTTPGISDMIRGDATFAQIAQRDFATQADVFGAGRKSVVNRATHAAERRNLLEFVERNYETVIIVCGDSDAGAVQELLTRDAALLVTVDGRNRENLAAAIARLKLGGMDDMILVDERQLAS